MKTKHKHLQAAVEVAGKVCFDINATRSDCIGRGLKLKVEIDKMIQALRCGKVIGRVGA